MKWLGALLLGALVACRPAPVDSGAPMSQNDQSSTASIQGVAHWTQDPPERKTINLQAYKQCQEIYKETPLWDESVLVSAGKRLANVFVYITNLPEDRKRPIPAAPVRLRHEKCVYIPRVLGMMKGQTLEIENADSFLHSDHLMSVVQPKADAVAIPDKIRKFRFDKPEVFTTFQCDLHPWEKAYIGVLDHHYFAVTASDGVFRLPEGLPPGKYSLRACHEKLGKKDLNVVIEAGKPAPSVDIRFP